MATQTTQGSGVTNNDVGTILKGGNVASTRFANVTLINNVQKYFNNSAPYASNHTGIQAAQLGSAVAITAITQSGSTGFVNIQKSSHGFAVGDLLVVYGANVTGYNTVHRVTVVTDSSNIQTDVAYSANTSTHGNYKAFSGLFNTMVAGYYIAFVIGKDTAGSSISALRLPGAHTSYRTGIHRAVGNQRYNVTSWNAVTGAATKGANAGDTVTYINISSGAALAAETKPSRAVPGTAVFGIGTNIPTISDYNSQTD